MPTSPQANKAEKISVAHHLLRDSNKISSNWHLVVRAHNFRCTLERMTKEGKDASANDDTFKRVRTYLGEVVKEKMMSKGDVDLERRRKVSQIKN